LLFLTPVLSLAEGKDNTLLALLPNLFLDFF
jgi:hypothetical protein